MIGRGTRLCKGLICSDQIDGEYNDKRRFLIFDYCGNFEFFRANINGFQSKEVKSLTENIFIKQLNIAILMQDAIYADESYQAWRSELVSTFYNQVHALNTDLISVRLNLQSVEKFKRDEAFSYISESDRGELISHIAPIVKHDDKDEMAKRFDNFMYGLIIADIKKLPSFVKAQKQLQNIAKALEEKISIPQVKAKLPIIQEINSEEFWNDKDILLFEKIRKELRDLIKFLVEITEKMPIYTKLEDPIIDKGEGSPAAIEDPFENYRAKVNRYVIEHSDTQAIYKLTHNIQLTAKDYKELEHILTTKLGSKEDYAKVYGDTPFGLMIRKIAKLDHQAAMAAFSQFINDQSLNQKQIAFVHKIINHIEQNGFMENVAILTKPPFDKPLSFTKLFDKTTQAAIMAAINKVRENAITIAA